MQPQQLRYVAPMQHPSDCHTSFYTKIPKLAPCLVHPTLETLCIEFGIANDYFSWLYELREVKLSITTTQLRQCNFNDGTLENLIRKCFQLRVFHIYGIAVHDVIKNNSRMAMNHEDTEGQMSPANVLDLLHTRRDTLKEVRIDMNRWDDLTRSDPYYGRNPAKFIYQNLRESRQLVELEIEAVRLDFDPCDMQASLESLTLTRCNFALDVRGYDQRPEAKALPSAEASSPHGVLERRGERLRWRCRSGEGVGNYSPGEESWRACCVLHANHADWDAGTSCGVAVTHTDCDTHVSSKWQDVA
jgi:hypothetical protein